MSLSFNTSAHKTSRKAPRARPPKNLIPTQTKLTYDNLPDFLRNIEDRPDSNKCSEDYHWCGPRPCAVCHEAKREGTRHYRQGYTDDEVYPVLAFWKCDNLGCGYEVESWEWYHNGKPKPKKVSKKEKKKEGKKRK